MIVWGVDPGYEQSAVVAWDGVAITHHLEYANPVLLQLFRERKGEPAFVLVIERFEAMGMAVGRTVFETVYWSGMFAEAWHPGRVERVSRHDVKLHVCHSRRAKDAEVRQAIIDRFGPGAEKAIGNRKNQGPLYGISKHEWSALAVALTFHDQHAAELRPGIEGDF